MCRAVLYREIRNRPVVDQLVDQLLFQKEKVVIINFSFLKKQLVYQLVYPPPFVPLSSFERSMALI